MASRRRHFDWSTCCFALLKAWLIELAGLLSTTVTVVNFRPRLPYVFSLCFGMVHLLAQPVDHTEDLGMCDDERV
jgi:hypothetical protein